MNHLPLYLLMVSYQREERALAVIENYINCNKPHSKVIFLVVENSEVPRLGEFFNFNEHQDILCHYFNNKNKAAAVNFAVENLIPEEEVLIVHVDNDVRFDPDFLLKYYEAAIFNGSKFFFGGSFKVEIPATLDPNLLPYVQGSAKGKSDIGFQKMQSLIFLGCSYSFFKSQWKTVNGLDERFSPGSKYNLGAEESVFQKKLKHAGYKPFFIKKNTIEHKPLPSVYSLENILKRQENNGYTHGFQDLIEDKDKFKKKYIGRLLYLIKKSAVLCYKGKVLHFKMKFSYAKGYFKAFPLFLRIPNRKSFLDF